MKTKYYVTFGCIDLKNGTITERLVVHNQIFDSYPTDEELSKIVHAGYFAKVHTVYVKE